MTRSFKRLAILALLLPAAACATTAYRQPADITWPVPPENPRIRYLESFLGSIYYAPTVGRNIVEFFAGADPSLILVKPLGVAADDKGNVYVSDAPGHVVMLDRVKETVRVVAGSGQARPLGVGGLSFYNPRNELIIADPGRHAVLVVDPEANTLKRMFAEPFSKPVGVAVDEARDRVAVADSAKHNVTVLNLMTGEVLFTVGGLGHAEGQMYFPLAVAFDKGGKLYVADTMNFRVQIFDENGQFVSTFGSLGVSLGQFSRPKGIGVDSEGHIYVVDAAFNNVQIFDESGNLLLFFGDAGGAPGTFQIPHGLFIDKQDRIYVVDQYNNRVQIFQYLNREASKRAGEAGRQALGGGKE
jgi:DNA-binding beta-propeller fold protein YncE